MEEQPSYADQIFKEKIFAERNLSKKEFQGCIFKSCDFSNSVFSETRFIDCRFESCNLSLIRLPKSTLNNLAFKDCKILGVDFSLCQDFLFTVNFENCILDLSSFMGKKMIKTRFAKSSLKEVSFSAANLSQAVFDECDLENAIFSSTNLSAADFRTAMHYTLDPELNTMKHAIFSAAGLEGLLSKYGIKVV